MLDVLLINPNYSKIADRAEGILPPLGLCYISAFLKMHNFSSKVLDANALNLNNSDVLEIIRESTPAIVGFTATTPLINYVYEISEIIKKNYPDIMIITGGPHPTVMASEILKENKFIDIVVKGEGEITTYQLIKEIKKGGSLTHIKGIAYRDKNNIVTNEPRDRIINLDSLPFPDRSDLPYTKYAPSIKWYKEKPFATLMTSRGCPNDCIFCASKNILGRAVRYRSPENVLNEIRGLISEYGVKEIMFYDDTFTLNYKHASNICDLIIKNNLNISWGCLSRVDMIDEQILLKMKESGCHIISYGIESGSPKMLKAMRKNINLSQAENAIKLTKKVGIDTSASFVFGIPGETKNTMQETIKFAKKIDPLFAQFYRVVPFPGTDLFELYMNQNKNIDWSTFLELGNTQNLIKLENINTKEFNQLLKSSYYEFYLRPKKIILLLFKMFRPYKIKGLFDAAVSFFKLLILKNTKL